MVILLVLFFPLGVWLPRNEAEARLLASRSAVQRQPKRAPIRGRLPGRILRWEPKPRVVPTPLNISNAFSRKPMPLQRHQVLSVLFFAVKACTSRCSPPGGENDPAAFAKR